jgi:LacI family transcriptional regulator
MAFIKGQAFSSDTEQRWQAIVGVAKALEIAIDEKLVVQLEGPEPGPGPGYAVTRELLKAKRGFTAIFAFNDVTAIGAIQALREEGLRVPKDVSVLGFDDVLIAATNDPPLTTIHQPLRGMGQVAASTLLGLIGDPSVRPVGDVITVHPRLVVRKSTSQAPQGSF